MTRTHSFAHLLGFGLAIALGGGCGTESTSATDGASPADAAVSPDQSQPAPKDIVDTAVAAGTFKALVASVQAAGLEATLRGAGPFTVFAPTDAAFGKLPPFLTANLGLPQYKAELSLILTYHVLSGAVKAADVLGKTQDVATVAGPKLKVDGSNNKVVLAGGAAMVTTPDVLATNGVIHIVDGVILPSIVDTAVAYNDGAVKFSTLVTAVTAAGLDGTLAGPGPFTVFAPTDAAFAALKAALGEAAFNAILADKAKLTKILTYHALTGSVFSKDVMNGAAVATVETDKLTFTVAGGAVTIADSTKTPAKVILADLPARNGVIHVIDKVLLPPGL